jgi:hypothetical protein
MHRNECMLSARSFSLAGRPPRVFRNPKISPQEAVEKHPELGVELSKKRIDIRQAATRW